MKGRGQKILRMLTRAISFLLSPPFQQSCIRPWIACPLVYRGKANSGKSASGWKRKASKSTSRYYTFAYGSYYVAWLHLHYLWSQPTAVADLGRFQRFQLKPPFAWILTFITYNNSQQAELRRTLFILQ